MATVRASSKAQQASAQAVTVTTPTGTTTGDRLYACVVVDNSSTDPIVDDSGDFGTALYDAEVGGFRMAVFGMALAGAPDASYTFSTAALAGPMLAVLVAVNPETDTFSSQATDDGSGDPTATLDFTGVANPSVLLGFWGCDGNRTVSVAPTGMTQLQDVDEASAELWAYAQDDAGEGALSKSLTVNTTGEGVGGFGVLLAYTGAAAGPTIDTQPVATSATDRTTANFTTAATGTGDLGYQWLVDKGAGFVNVDSGTGGTTASYTTGTLQPAMNGWSYACDVTDDNGTTRTDTATLTVTASATSILLFRAP